MSRSTPRSRLRRAAAPLLALALTAGWSASGSVLARSSVDQGERGAAPLLAPAPISRVTTVGAASAPAWREQLDDLRAAGGAVPAGAAVAAASQPAPRAAAKPAAAKTAAIRPTYTGVNRFWIPSLGMNDKVHLFECTRSRDPDNLVYRWGCAGANNVYILGHAYGVMKPLHDLYVRGGLHKGMVAIFADGHGRIHWYKVTSWRVVDPTEAAWAIAAQPVPSMTIQTCVGKAGHLRLNIRLVQFKVT